MYEKLDDLLESFSNYVMSNQLMREQEANLLYDSFSYRLGFLLTYLFRYLFNLFRGLPRPDLYPSFVSSHSARALSHFDVFSERVFDPLYYLNKYDDIRSYCEGDIAKAKQHWCLYGIKEGRRGSPSFDLVQYNRKICEEYGMIGNYYHLSIYHYLTIKIGHEEVSHSDDKLLIDSDAFHHNSAGYYHAIGKIDFRSEKKSVLLVAHRIGAYDYGGERSFWDLIEAISKDDYNLYIVIPNRSENFEKRVFDYCTELIYFDYTWWNHDLVSESGTTNVFRTIIRNYKIDLIHSNTIMVLDSLVAGKLEGIPALMHLRELITKDEDLQRVLKCDGQTAIEVIKNRVDHFVCNSRSTCDEFGLVDRKSLLLYNTIDDDLFNLTLSKDDNIKVSLISSNIKKKGIEDFVKIACSVVQNRSNITFQLIGEVTEYLQSLDEKYNFETNKITVCGYIEKSLEAVGRSDIILNLSSFAESFGRTIAEGMAGGKLVIGYDWGAISELIDHGESGYLVEYGKWHEIVKILNGIDRNTISALGRTGRIKALKHFSKQVFRSKLNLFYSELLGVEEWDSNFYNSCSDKAIPDYDNLRVGYFLWHFPVPSETFVLNELKYLVDNNIEVKVFCKESPFPNFEFNLAIDVIKISDPLDLKIKILENDITFMHAHFVYPTVTNYVWPVCDELSLPFTVMTHAQDIFKYENIELNRIKNISRSDNCIRVLTLGQYHKKFLIKQGVPREKVFINPQFINFEKFNLNIKSRGFSKVIVIGRFVEKKGFQNLVQAANLLARYDISFHLYGYGEMEQFLKTRIDSSGISNLELKGRVKTAKELSDLFSQYDLLLQPSQATATGDMDGIPTVLIEAMSSGLPVITTPIASITDIIKDGINGILIGSNHPQLIVDAILDVYNMDDRQLTSIALNARNQVERTYQKNKLLGNLLKIWSGYSIDIILVTYINETYPNLSELREVVQRIYKFTQFRFNLIIVDNGSDIETINYLKKIESQFDNIDVIYSKVNLYVGGGTNIALQKSSKRYVIYICAVEGFILKEGWEIDLISSFENAEKVGLVGTKSYSPSYLFGRDLPSGIKLFEHFRNKSYQQMNMDKKFFHIQGGAFAINRDMFRTIGGFNHKTPHAYTDVEYSYFAESENWKLCNNKSTLSLYEKSRPNIYSRINEQVSLLHPGTLKDLDLLDKIAHSRVNICNICEWSGIYDKKKICPKCNSYPIERSLFRQIAESDLSFRGLDLLLIGDVGYLEEAFLKKAFRFTKYKFQKSGEEVLCNLRDSSIDFIIIGKCDEQILTLKTIGQLERVIVSKGSLILTTNPKYYNDFDTMSILLKKFGKKNFDLVEKKLFDSNVVHYSLYPLIILNHPV